MPVYRSRSLFNERNNTRKIVFDGVRLRVLPPVGCRPYRVIISCGCVVRVVIISPPGIRVRLSSCYVRVALGYTPLVRTNKSLSLMIVCRPVHHATSTTGYTTSQAPLDQQCAQPFLEPFHIGYHVVLLGSCTLGKEQSLFDSRSANPFCPSFETTLSFPYID